MCGWASRTSGGCRQVRVEHLDRIAPLKGGLVPLLEKALVWAIHLVESPAGYKAYSVAHNAVRRVRGRFDADLRAERITAIGREPSDGVVHQETNFGWVGSDVFDPFPTPPMSRHKALAAIQDVVQPRGYLEIGIDNGASLQLVTVPAIGVDPQPRINVELGAHVHVEAKTSDDFFTLDEPLAHLNGVPLDFAFVDGMHLAEFALRDFMNLERLMPRHGVIVLDDVLPRNSLEAFRTRRTHAWAGDVYKVLEILERHRPDLVVLPLNTGATGIAVVTNLDPSSTVLTDMYPKLESVCTVTDPQTVSERWTRRQSAVDPREVVRCPAWDVLVASRSGDLPPEAVDVAMDQLRAIAPMKRWAFLRSA